MRYLIPPRGSASPVLLSVRKVVFEVVGVDLPIKVLLTSGAGVIVVLFSVIVGAIRVVMFVLFNSIESDGMPSCANIGWLITIVSSSFCTSIYERNIPAMSINRLTITVELAPIINMGTYTNN